MRLYWVQCFDPKIPDNDNVTALLVILNGQYISQFQIVQELILLWESFNQINFHSKETKRPLFRVNIFCCGALKPTFITHLDMITQTTVM